MDGCRAMLSRLPTPPLRASVGEAHRRTPITHGASTMQASQRLSARAQGARPLSSRSRGALRVRASTKAAVQEQEIRPGVFEGCALACTGRGGGRRSAAARACSTAFVVPADREAMAILWCRAAPACSAHGLSSCLVSPSKHLRCAAAAACRDRRRPPCETALKLPRRAPHRAT